jgi:hypothetical protein
VPATSYVSRFYGDIWSVDADYNATAIAFGNLFDRKFPRFLLSVTDNYTQFSAPTQLDANSFKITGTLPALITLHRLVVTSAAGFMKASEYFAGGWLETERHHFERRGILHSEPTAPNKVTLHIDRPLIKNLVPVKAALNAAVLRSVCFPVTTDRSTNAKPNSRNRINFGGHPYIPNVNPAVKAMKPKNVQGGKK